MRGIHPSVRACHPANITIGGVACRSFEFAQCRSRKREVDLVLIVRWNMANAWAVPFYRNQSEGATLMRARLAMAVVFGCMAWTVQAAAAPIEVDGDWIGGFEGADGPVFITAHFDVKGDALSGL